MSHDMLRPVGVQMNHGPIMFADELQSDLVARLSPLEARLRYVTDLLAPMLRVEPAKTRNAWYAAGRLLGGCGMTGLRGEPCDGSAALAETLVRMMVRHGSLAGVQKARRPCAPLVAGPLPTNLVGVIFFAKFGADDATMVGFSTRPQRRLRDLKAETGEEHRIESWFVGTAVDEAVARIALAERDGGRPRHNATRSKPAAHYLEAAE